MNRVKRLSLILVTIISSAGCDQVTKSGAQLLLQDQPSVSYFGGLFSFTYAENTGGMLSLGASLPEELRFFLLVAVAGLLVFGALVYVVVGSLNTLAVFSLSLIIGGGVSNLCDRIFNDGSVVDFMLVRVGSLQTGIFNVADVVLMVGMVIFWFTAFKSEKIT